MAARFLRIFSFWGWLKRDKRKTKKIRGKTTSTRLWVLGKSTQILFFYPCATSKWISTLGSLVFELVQSLLHKASEALEHVATEVAEVMLNKPPGRNQVF